MSVKRVRRAGMLAVVWLICLLPGALAGRMVYGGEEKAAPGALYPYDSPEGCCLIDLNGGVYADDGYFWINILVSDAGERRFAAMAAEGEDRRCYLLDEMGRPITDGACSWITVTGDDIIFQSADDLYGLYGWNGETLVEPVYSGLISTGDGSYIGLMDYRWQIEGGEVDLVRPGEPTGRIRLGDGKATSLDDFHGGLAAATVYDGERSLTGFVDATGSWRIQPVYDSADGFIGDYSVAWLNGYAGLIDRGGNAVLPFVYDNIFFDSVERPRALAAQQGSIVTVFDAETFGELFQLGDVEYGWFERSAALVARGASNGQTRAYSLEGKLICVLRDENKVLTIVNEDRYCVNDYGDYTYKVCDFRGNTLMSGAGLMYGVTGADGACALRFNAFHMIDCGDGSTTIDWNREHCGLYDLDCREILEPKYDYIVQVCEGYYAIQRGPWHGVVNSEGEWVIRRSNYTTLMD